MADIAVLGFDIDSTPARTAATDLAKLQNAATKLASSMAKTDTALRRANGQFASSAEVVAEYGREVQELAAKYNPALSAVYKFQQAEAELNRALMLGVVTNEQYDASLERVRLQLAQQAEAAHAAANGVRMVGTAARTGGDAMEVSGHHAANLSFQLNDIGMMMASGQSPFMLMIQQGPQVAQVFSQMTAQGQRIGPTLASAFRMILNPTTLLTLAVVGGAAALFQWATASSDAEKGAEEFLTTLTELEAAVGRVGSTPSLLTSEGVEQLRASYGALTADVRSLVTALGEAEVQQARMAARATLDEILGSFDAGFFTTRMQAVANVTGLAADEARRFEIQLNLLAVADGPEEQLRIMTGLRKMLEDAGQTSTGLYQSLVRAESEMRKIANATDDAQRFMSLFSQTAAQTSLNHLVAQAAALATNVRSAADALNSFSGGATGALSGGLIDAATGMWDAALDRLQSIESGGLGDRPSRRPFELGIPDLPDTGTGGGGGGGGGASAVDQIQEDFKNRWQALQEGFKGEFDLSLVEYQKQLETLDWALSQKLIKEQEFQRNKQLLYTMTFGTEYEQQQLQYQLELDALTLARENELIAEADFIRKRNELYSGAVSAMGTTTDNLYALQLGQLAGHLGEMSQLAGGGYDKLLKAQRVFAAASALISTYQGAAKALELPFPYNLFAAGKVIAAGVGFVSAIKSATSSGASTGGGGGSAQAAVQSQAAQQEPNREVLVRLEGDEWLVGMASNIMEQIYDQTKDGRVVVARDF